jgi:group I intron endonuclease
MRLETLNESEDKSGIWVNNINGNTYIGSAVNLNNRLKQHLYNINSSVPLQRAILKYELSNFSIEVLEYCPIEQLIEREQFYLDTLNPEYNIHPITGSPLGLKHSEETKKKISIAQFPPLGGAVKPRRPDRR